jgi:hypothetical protein
MESIIIYHIYEIIFIYKNTDIYIYVCVSIHIYMHIYSKIPTFPTSTFLCKLYHLEVYNQNQNHCQGTLLLLLIAVFLVPQVWHTGGA